MVAGDLRLNGSWQYSKDDDQSSDFSHTYSANYSGSTNLTELIGLSGNMRYTRSSSDDTTLSETYSPSLRLNNQNDIYNLALVGNYNVRRSDDLQRDDWMWNSNFSSNWAQRLFLPSLGMFYGQSRSFTDEDATPSVKGGEAFKTANTQATTITDFDNTYDGQVFSVIIGDANTTVDFTATNLKGNGGGDWSPAVNDSMTVISDGTTKWCDISDNTA